LASAFRKSFESGESSSMRSLVGRIVGLTLIVTTAAARAEAPRKPEALLMIDGGARLLVANRGTGTVSVVDVKGRRVEKEVAVGRGLSDLRATADADAWLAVDRGAGEVVRIGRRGGAIVRIDAARVDDAARAAVYGDGRRAIVLSPGSRQATLLAWDGAEGLRAVGSIDLPFGPLDAAVLPGGSEALATDAHGGRIALLDLEAKAVRRTWTLPDHNLRAPTITPDGKGVAILAQNAAPYAISTRESVQWSLFMRSWIRIVRIADLRSPDVTDDDLVEDSRTVLLGVVGNGSANPSGLAFGPKGEVAAAVAGTDHVASALGLGEPYDRIPVGRSPVAVAIDPTAAFAYSADAFDDAVTVLDLAAGKPAGVIALSADAGKDGRRPPATLVEEGEALFSDARLSEDGWMSCQTCHADGHTSGVLADTLGDGSYGAAKRTPSLLGVADTAPYGWTGGMRKLEDQVRKSIDTTMRGPEPTPRQVEALTAYLRTLAAPKPAPPADPQAVARGREVFESGRCDACHTEPTYTTPMTYDVGLTDAVGNRAFNPPSLLGVGLRPALLHDAAATSLDDLFRRVKHPDQADLTDREIADLTAFLKSL